MIYIYICMYVSATKTGAKTICTYIYPDYMFTDQPQTAKAGGLAGGGGGPGRKGGDTPGLSADGRN
jgi:hypothetical protein